MDQYDEVAKELDEARYGTTAEGAVRRFCRTLVSGMFECSGLGSLQLSIAGDAGVNGRVTLGGRASTRLFGCQVNRLCVGASQQGSAHNNGTNAFYPSAADGHAVGDMRYAVLCTAGRPRRSTSPCWSRWRRRWRPARSWQRA